MQVSAVSANSSNSVFNTRANKFSFDGFSDFSNFCLTPSNQKIEDRVELYESINEWKSFCHSQICKGKLDVIA